MRTVGLIKCINWTLSSWPSLDYGWHIKWLQNFENLSLMVFSDIYMPLTHFMPLVSFYSPWKHQNTRGFSDVFRGYRKRPCHEMGKDSKKWEIKLIITHGENNE